MTKTSNLIAGLGLCCVCLFISTEAQVQFKNSSNSAKLLELYTSQGCSSCPPAENWISSLKKHPHLWTELFPISFHVSYWDYLGWEDPFADPVYRNRQENLAAENQMETIYTPGFFLNGVEWRDWRSGGDGVFNNNSQGPKEQNNKSNSGAELSLVLADKTLRANLNLGKGRNETSNAAAKNFRLHIVILEFDKKTNIRRGENAGKNLTQDFIVSWYHRADSENRSWLVSMDTGPLKSEGKKAMVGWVSLPDSETPVQIAGGWLKF